MDNIIWNEAQNDQLLSYPCHIVSLVELLLQLEDPKLQKLYTQKGYFISKLQLAHKFKKKNYI